MVATLSNCNVLQNGVCLDIEVQSASFMRQFLEGMTVKMVPYRERPLDRIWDRTGHLIVHGLFLDRFHKS